MCPSADVENNVPPNEQKNYIIDYSYPTESPSYLSSLIDMQSPSWGQQENPFAANHVAPGFLAPKFQPIYGYSAEVTHNCLHLPPQISDNALLIRELADAIASKNLTLRRNGKLHSIMAIVTVARGVRSIRRRDLLAVAQ